MQTPVEKMKHILFAVMVFMKIDSGITVCPKGVVLEYYLKGELQHKHTTPENGNGYELKSGQVQRMKCADYKKTFSYDSLIISTK